jgi:light-regulated signal transduction histidine kinase (bacteriophytochrome)
MTALVDDLGELSRIAQAPLAPQRLDLGDMAQALALGDAAGTPVELSVAPGLVTTADAALTRIALDNLLRNARQYTSKQPEARIEFGMRQQDGRDAFYVRDNGPGFDLPQDRPLFAHLQRLGSLEEFAGAGVRFALAERAVLRQGGAIWAESAAGAGSVFYFTLSP